MKLALSNKKIVLCPESIGAAPLDGLSQDDNLPHPYRPSQKCGERPQAGAVDPSSTIR
jgi:hypothetical protein